MSRQVTNWSATGITMRAEVDLVGADDSVSVIVLDVVQFVSEFAINDIPAASIIVAVGQNVDTINPVSVDLNGISAVHTKLLNVGTLLPARVFLFCESIRGQPRPESWPEDEFLVFEGYATGSSYKKTSTGAEYAFTLIHWLTDLNFSSAITRTTHPLSPGQVSYFATLSPVSSSGGLFYAMDAASTASLFFDSGIVTSDFWAAPSAVTQTGGVTTTIQSAIAGAFGKSDAVLGFNLAGALNSALQNDLNKGAGLRRVFIELALQDRLAYSSAIANLNVSNNPNWEALRALKRFEPQINDSGANVGYDLGVPLALKGVDPVSGALVAQTIAQDISTLMWQSMASYTFWDKLIELASDYQFMVVPMVDRALVEPFGPTIRTPWWRTIYANTIDRVENSSSLIRPLRGVVLYMGREQSLSGGVVTGVSRAAVTSHIAAYEATLMDGVTKVQTDGMLIFKQAPRWLSRIPFNSYPKPGAFVFPTSILPGIPPLPLNLNIIPAPTAFQAMQPLVQAYAKSLYMTEILRSRQAQVAGRLRFDIAPGSRVVFEAPGIDSPIAPTGELGLINYYGMVLRVTTVINSETGAAGTSFHVGYVRSLEENESDSPSGNRARLSVDEHPLWGTHDWSGGPLVNEPEFRLVDKCYNPELSCP